MISASLACADYLNLGEDIRKLDQAQIDFHHIDIMDGHFVPNLSLNFDLVKQVRSISKTPMDVHLMVKNPFDYVDIMGEIGIEYACTHLSACQDGSAFLQELKKKGIKAGLVLELAEPVIKLESYLPLLDYVLVMAVRPGFSGQQFNPSSLAKIEELVSIRKRENLEFLIQIDGGIGPKNGRQALEAGADILVAGVFAVFLQGQDLYQSSVEFKSKLKNGEVS